ncbi:MAG: hypothetical protein K2O81_00025 [Clostridia bacterium]|nr:hypothetical protein [Clostridia bacterium]
MADDSNPKLGLYYEMVLKRCENFNNPYVFIDKQTLELWRQEYIQLLPDESNWDAYWNQVFEVDARAFAALFTGVLWE